MDCPSEHRLASDLTPEVAAHLAACPTCAAKAAELAAWRSAFVLAEVLRPAVLLSSPRSAWKRPILAAAALLALVSLAAWARKPESPLPPLLSPAPVQGLESGALLEAPERTTRWILPAGDRLALEAGASVHVADAGNLELMSGRLWMEAASGRERAIRLPGGREVRLADAEIVVTLTRSQGMAVFLRAAHAAEAAEAEILCRRGVCRVLWEGKAWPLAAGTLIRLKPGLPPVPAVLSPEAAADATRWVWEVLSGADLAALAGSAEGLAVVRTGRTLLLNAGSGSGRLPLGPGPAGDYRLSMSLRLRRAGGDLGLAFPAGTRFPCWMMGASREPLPVGRWIRLAVERRGERIRFWRNGALTASAEIHAADRVTPAETAPALALWGAEVEVADLQWMGFAP